MNVVIFDPLGCLPHMIFGLNRVKSVCFLVEFWI
nr:MAG TPA: hypothetical protein [Caudoviricetes sp.]